ncbi:MAG: hypothetical protein LBU39_07215 [Desulfobulbaceae bacterium]|nr:hypothetical protein [Desulfobulbaceae bacterium]
MEKVFPIISASRQQFKDFSADAASASKTAANCGGAGFARHDILTGYFFGNIRQIPAATTMDNEI